MSNQREKKWLLTNIVDYIIIIHDGLTKSYIQLKSYCDPLINQRNIVWFQPSLQKYQERNHPSYIQNQNRMKLESQGVLRKDEPVSKKMKRAGSVEPMEKPESPLPELPGNLQQKQVHFFFLTIYVLNINTHVYGYFHNDTLCLLIYLPLSNLKK